MGLNEQLTYIGGVMPRNKQIKTVSYSASSVGNAIRETILDVTGPGAFVYARINTSGPGYLWYGRLTITLDGNKKIYIGTVADGTETSCTTSLTTDLNSVYNDWTGKYPCEFIKGKTWISNGIFKFDNSCSILVEAYRGSNLQGVSFIAQYTMF